MTLFATPKRPDQLLSSEPVRLTTAAGIDELAVLEERTIGQVIRTTRFIQRPGITMQRFIEWYWGENADFCVTLHRAGKAYTGTGRLTQRPQLADGSPATFATSTEEPLQLRILLDEYGLEASQPVSVHQMFNITVQRPPFPSPPKGWRP